MMIRVTKPMLEKHQVAIYFIAVFAGLLVAAVVGRSSVALAAWINPALAALLYVTFLQVPMISLLQVLTHGRFLSALLIVNLGFEAQWNKKPTPAISQISLSN